MTGLDITRDHLIEIAVLITDGDLNVVSKGPSLVIHQPKEVMDNMNDWCIQHHGTSGLTKEVLESTLTAADAEKQVVDFLSQHIEKGVAPLAGNTVHEDKRFLYKEMPGIIEYLHYRIVDVSTVKELARRWHPSLPGYKKQGEHRALGDIIESIEELKYYKETLFQSP
ncbi:ribonuclease H-like domain-containing protein [Pilobolus umbonatus]|nr:ribonuclease H-like domain-containing protein [Pilobolus umbonatus]